MTTVPASFADPATTSSVIAFGSLIDLARLQAGDTGAAQKETRLVANRIYHEGDLPVLCKNAFLSFQVGRREEHTEVGVGVIRAYNSPVRGQFL